MISRQAVRVVIVICMTMLSTVHYQAGQWLFFIGDCLVGGLIILSWSLPFYLAARKQNQDQTGQD